MTKIFPNGIYYNKPRQGAPEFVRGSISIKVDEAVPFLQKNKNAQGYVNLDMLLSKDKALYLALNEWKKPESMEKKSNGFNSDGSPVPNFDVKEEIEAEEVFNSWNDPKRK